MSLITGEWRKVQFWETFSFNSFTILCIKIDRHAHKMRTFKNNYINSSLNRVHSVDAPGKMYCYNY
jgi:hypothetical protein